MHLTSNDRSNLNGGFQLWHLINFLFGLTWPGMFFILTQTFVKEVTGSPADAGMVMGVIGLGALTAPVFGRIADRHRAHRPVQILTFGLVIVGMLIMAFSSNEMAFMLAAMSIGVGLAPAGMITILYAVGSGLSKEAEGRTVASIQRMAFAGQIVGGLAIGGLLQLQEQGVLSYRMLFVICACVVAVALLLAIFATRKVAARVSEVAAQRVEKANQDAPPGKFSLGDLLKSAFGLALLVIFLNHLGWTGVVGQYVNFMEGAFGVDRSITSSVNSIAVLISLFVIGPTGKWLVSSGPVSVLSVGIVARVILGFGLVLIGSLMGGTAGAIAVALPLLVWVAFRLVNPFTEVPNPVLAARTAIGGAAQAQAMMTAVLALAISLGNFLGGQLAERLGWMALPWQTVVFCSLAFLVAYFGVRPRLQEGSNEPDPEMLLAERELET